MRGSRPRPLLPAPAGWRRRRRLRAGRARLWLGLGVLLGALAAPARADRSFDVARVNLPVDAYGMAALDRAQTPQRYEFGFQALSGWALAPFKATLIDPNMGTNMGMQEERFNVIEHQFTLDIGAYLGLFDFLAIAAVMPLAYNVYDQNVVGELVLPQQPAIPTGTAMTSPSGLYRNQPRQNVGVSSAGPRDPRLAVKVRFYAGRSFELGTLLEVTVPLGNSASFMGDKSATFRPKLLAGLMFGRFNLALHLGAIVRDKSALNDPGNPTLLRYQVSHELTFGAGLGWRLHRLVSLSVETFGTVPVAGDATSADLDLLGTLFIRPTRRLRLLLSGGGGLISDSPRRDEGRLLLGLAYTLSPRGGEL